jgi:hypothetical protein
VAIAEAVTVTSVMLRFALKPGEVHLDRSAHLVWFVACLALPMLGVGFFVVRTAALLRRQAQGEAVEDERKQALAFSLALIIPPLALSWLGPRVLESLFR